MGVILGADGGNSKTELVAATLDGELLAHVRGPGSNCHGPEGVEGTADVLAELVERTGVDVPVGSGVFYLCGADVPSDIADLLVAIISRGFVRSATVDNDTFALLRAGTDAPDAVAIVCGAGINCVGRSADGRIARYPSLGWETGDWGGSEELGREALSLAARAEDGRGAPTALAELVRSHFGRPSVAEVGEAVHYRRIPAGRLGDLAGAIVRVAADGDDVARSLVERLADEIGLLAARAFRDLGLGSADVVLGGGMLQPGSGLLHDLLLERLPPAARPVVLRSPPVLGAALAALDAAGATSEAKVRLRQELRAG